jgi:hypothetical protein
VRSPMGLGTDRAKLPTLTAWWPPKAEDDFRSVRFTDRGGDAGHGPGGTGGDDE